MKGNIATNGAEINFLSKELNLNVANTSHDVRVWVWYFWPKGSCKLREILVHWEITYSTIIMASLEWIDAFLPSIGSVLKPRPVQKHA